MIDVIPTPGGPVKRLSLRGKLTLWMLATFLVVQLSLGLVFELYQSRSINAVFDQRIALRVEQFAKTIVFGLPTSEISDAVLSSYANAPQVLLSDRFVIDVLDADRRLLATSLRPGVPLGPGVLQEAAKVGHAIVTPLPSGAIVLSDGEKVSARAAIVPINTVDGRRFFVVVAVNDDQAQQLLQTVSRVILVSSAIGVLASIISAYLIAGAAVRPLLVIRTAASQLSPESIGRQLTVPTAPVAEEVAAVQRELELARQRIEAGFAAQERFMSNVSHELKTPIATILTEAQVVKKDNATPEVREFFRSATEELEKLARMVDSFLLLTRVRHGKVQVTSAETCIMRDVLVDSYASCASMAAQYGVRIDLQLPEGDHANAAVMGNCDLVRIIFDNIIRNAIRFSPAGSVIQVRAWVEGTDVHVAVRDRGTGIPPELLPRIFDRFAQAKDEQRRGRGHGLGLEIALGVAELHAGTISVRNCDDAGCEFTIRLPLAPGSACEKCETAPA